MKQDLSNRIALVAAVLAALLGLASAMPPSDLLAGGLGAAALALLMVATQMARAPTASERKPGAGAGLVGTASAFLVLGLLLLLVAAVLARFAGVRYLGSGPLFVAQNFTLVTGPFTALLALAPILAARGLLTLARAPTVNRRILTFPIEVLLLAGAAAVALAPNLPFHVWNAPYLLAGALMLIWWDATALLGLPTPMHVSARLERAETAQMRALLTTIAHLGNGSAALLGLAGAGLHFVGFPAIGSGLVFLALVLLAVSTHAAASLRKALPVALDDDLETREHQNAVLRMLAMGPMAAGFLTFLLALGAIFAITMGRASLLEALTMVSGGLGVLVGVLAGVNVVRARFRSLETYGPGRRAAATVAVSAMAVSAFFGLLVHLGVMAGPVVGEGLLVMFDAGAVTAAAVYVLVRGLYPVPFVSRIGHRSEAAPKARETAEDYKDRIERTMLYVYIAGGAFVLLTVGLLAFITLGGYSVKLPKSAAGRNATFLLLLGLGVGLIVGLVALFLQSRRITTVPQGQLVLKRRYTKREVTRLSVLGLSLTIAVILGFLGILTFAGKITSFAGIPLESKHGTDFFVFAILVGLGPAGYLHNREHKRISAIDQRLPEFLRDLAEGQRTGMTLTQAVLTSSHGSYGALTPEIKKMAAQIEWGVSFEEALQRFAKRVSTPLVQRTASLIIEASSSGGNVIDVLTAASDDAREIHQIQAERKGGMQMYVMIIYIAFLVFLGVIAVLNSKFMPEVAKAVAGASGVTIGSITFAEFDIEAFRTVFFHCALVQGLGGGFVAGAMEEGKPVAGLRHAVAMTIIAYVVFRLLIGG